MKNRISVLVVEENQTFSMYLALLLQRLGFKSLRVSQPEAAKFVVSRGFSDILVVGGREDPEPLPAVVGRLAGSSPGDRMPTIVISDHDTPEEKQACLAAGCQAYLVKPLQPKQLQDALYSCFSPFAERRLNLRSKVDLFAAVGIDGRPPEPLKVLTLSRGGALIGYDRLLAPDMQVTLTLHLDQGPLPLNGSVLYNLNNFDAGRQHAFGLVFDRPSRAQTELIENYLSRILEQCHLLTRDIEAELPSQGRVRI
ncbi:MAG TPA: PilZ domain-containing protein [Desulfuromonadales bacterium]|nr:PilZ domain-containing protein [Desulfuromonadales bacterium]